MEPPKDAAANRERERDLRDRIFKDRDTRDSKEIRDNRDPRERHYESRRRSRSPREKSYREYSSRGSDRERERPRERERDRSRDRGRDRSRDRDLSATSVLPLDEWPRKLKHWDVPPLGFEGMSAMQVKATGK